ncbi:cystatin domain-containing protein [Enterococcus faecalis]|uniref:cystatin domain-containing protein n=1 Tax=Enterococcus faecalis TaxID=1351 RepID=UPI003513A909
MSNAVPTPSRPRGKTNIPDVDKYNEDQVGGKTDIPDVANNTKVQDLGRFSVEEHNKSVQNATPLSFVRVEKAQSQIVAGTNYFLSLAATDGQGKEGKFDAQVFVPLGPNPAKKLVSFTPSKPGQ